MEKGKKKQKTTKTKSYGKGGKTRVITTGIDVIFPSKENEQKVLKGRNSKGLEGVSELVRESRNTSFLGNPPKHV